MDQVNVAGIEMDLEVQGEGPQKAEALPFQTY